MTIVLLISSLQLFGAHLSGYLHEPRGGTVFTRMSAPAQKSASLE